MERKPLPIGIEDFKRLIDDKYHFVDKTLMIKELIESQTTVGLFTRPRRVGKTLNMSMPIFKVFLSIIYYIASLNPQDNISFSFINFFCACCFIRFWYLKFYNIITTNFVFYRIHDFNHNNTPIILFYIKMVNFLIFTYLTLIVNK